MRSRATFAFRNGGYAALTARAGRAEPTISMIQRQLGITGENAAEEGCGLVSVTHRSCERDRPMGHDDKKGTEIEIDVASAVRFRSAERSLYGGRAFPIILPF